MPSAKASSRPEPSTGRRLPLFWRLFLPNAAVLATACVVLIIAPANGRIPILVSGLAVMLVANVVLMRLAFAPLQRLVATMRAVDPLRPGVRIPVDGATSEVHDLTLGFNDMLDRLEGERRDSARRALRAQEDERRHLASEMHDELGQALTATVLELRRIADAVPGDLRDDVLSLRETVDESLQSVRDMSRRLRPEALDDLGLTAALTLLCDRAAEQARVPVDARLERELPALSEEAELVVYRIAQESLTNAMRHAAASRVDVALRRRGDGVVLTVSDDGGGLRTDPARSDGGIRGMRERALLVGASLTVGRSSAGGVEVTLGVPGG
jgi:two-component system sensor histidine kinase UhpB